MLKCPDIDYKIWCQRNVYYGDNPIDPAGLTNAKKGGLITRDFSSIDELLNLLATKIENYTFDNDNEDELFLVLKGSLKIEFRTKTVELSENEMFIIPRGVEHKPIAEKEVAVLLFEPKDTLNTGNQRAKLTQDKLDWI